MTREEFVNKHRPELMGFVAELWGMRNADTRSLGLLFDGMHLKARRLLDAIWTDFQTPPPEPLERPAAANGHVNGNGNHTNGRRP